MAYNHDIWEDLTEEERGAYKIFEVFQIYAHKQGLVRNWLPSASTKYSYEYERDGKYPGDKIREHKNWPIFTMVYEMYKNDEIFDPYIFMESIFRGIGKNDKIYPGMLKTKRAKDGYYQYKSDLRELSSDSNKIKDIEMKIVGTYKFLQIKVGKSELSAQDLDDFFNRPKKNTFLSEGLVLCIYQMLSPYYLVVSKAFIKAWAAADLDLQEEILPKDKLKLIHSFVKINPRLYSFIKRVFGNDIIKI